MSDQPPPASLVPPQASEYSSEMRTLAAPADLALAEDQRLLAAWRETLASRREERTKLQARHRDRL